MEYRRLGGSDLKVSVLSFGTATFGGSNPAFRAWGETDVREARRLLDVAMDAGVNFFDTADVYSDGMAEQILGEAFGTKRGKILLATKAGYRTEAGPEGIGSSRAHLLRACEASLRRLKTDYIDLYQLHAFDALTPIEETLGALDELIRSGKVRYVGCSNFSGWHLMKSLAVAEKGNLPRYVSHQVYYSLLGREFEWELLPLALDQNVGSILWSPLAGARLTGKIRRGQPLPEGTRTKMGAPYGPPVEEEQFYRIVELLAEIAAEEGRSIAQIALNWLIQRPSVSSIIVGARNEAQLAENLGAVGWSLSGEQIRRLEEASDRTPAYPYWHQRDSFAERNPPFPGR